MPSLIVGHSRHIHLKAFGINVSDTRGSRNFKNDRGSVNFFKPLGARGTRNSTMTRGPGGSPSSLDTRIGIMMC